MCLLVRIEAVRRCVRCKPARSPVAFLGIEPSTPPSPQILDSRLQDLGQAVIPIALGFSPGKRQGLIDAWEDRGDRVARRQGAIGNDPSPDPAPGHNGSHSRCALTRTRRRQGIRSLLHHPSLPGYERACARGIVLRRCIQVSGCPLPRTLS